MAVARAQGEGWPHKVKGDCLFVGARCYAERERISMLGLGTVGQEQMHSSAVERDVCQRSHLIFKLRAPESASVNIW